MQLRSAQNGAWGALGRSICIAINSPTPHQRNSRRSDQFEMRRPIIISLYAGRIIIHDRKYNRGCNTGNKSLGFECIWFVSVSSICHCMQLAKKNSINAWGNICDTKQTMLSKSTLVKYLSTRAWFFELFPHSSIAGKSFKGWLFCAGRSNSDLCGQNAHSWN
jgi:hypothetical protein